MTSPVAVIGLEWDGLDLQRADLDILFWIIEGLDDLPETRGRDEVIPFRTGRLPGERMGDHRPIVAAGWVTRPSASVAGAYRAYVDDLKRRLDPTGPPRILVATLEDATRRWINAVPRNLLPGDELGSDFRAFSIEWDALDPFWYGAYGYSALDSGLLLDDGEALDQGAWIVVTPTSTAHALEIDTLSTVAVQRIRVELTGPSSTPPGLEVVTPDGIVGFVLGAALTAGQVADLDNDARTVEIAGTSQRATLTLRPANRHGEYVRLLPGINSVRVLGQPAKARILFTPTYQ